MVVVSILFPKISHIKQVHFTKQRSAEFHTANKIQQNDAPWHETLIFNLNLYADTQVRFFPSKHVLLPKSFVLLKVRLQHKNTVFYTIPFSFPNQPLQCFIPQASPATLDPWFSICCWLKHVNPPWFDPFTLCSSTMAIENASNMEVSMAKLVKLIARGLPPQSPGLTPPAPWRCRSPVSAPSLPWPAWPPVRRPYGRRGSSTARSTWGRRRGRSPRSTARSDGWGEWLPGDRWWLGDVEKSW